MWIKSIITYDGEVYIEVSSNQYVINMIVVTLQYDQNIKVIVKCLQQNYV